MNHLMKIIELVPIYLESKALSWSDSTKESESLRLNRWKIFMDTPDNLWTGFEMFQLGAYARRTTWIRVVNFYDWMIQEGYIKDQNIFRAWQNEHRRLFKHVYERHQPTVTFSQARDLIQTINNNKYRDAALFLLDTGLRISEITAIRGSKVKGKGGKVRTIFKRAPEGIEGISIQMLRKELRKIGLKPHDLRKILATHLYESGLSQRDLMAVFGWETFETASAYIAAKKEDDLAKIIQGATA